MIKKSFAILFAAVPALIVIALLTLAFTDGLQQPTLEQQPTTLTLGIATWAGFGTGIVGMEKGFFGDLQVETKTLDDARARQAAFVAGDLDIMISSVDLFAQEAAKKIPGKAFLVTDESKGGDGIIAKSDIKTVADLRGKKIAYAHGGPSDYLIFKVLDDAGIGLDEVERITVDDPSRAGEVFLSGDVDAAVTWEPFLSNAVESGKGEMLITTADKPEIIVDILIASEQLEQDTELLNRFMDSWLKTVDFIQANPDEAAAIMAKGLNLPEGDVQGMMLGLSFADTQRNQYFFDNTTPAQSQIAQLFNEAGAYWKSIDVLDQPESGAIRISKQAITYFTPAN